MILPSGNKEKGEALNIRANMNHRERYCHMMYLKMYM